MDKYKDEDIESLSEAKWQLLTTSFKSNKELEKVKGIRDLILQVNPDICLFTEVGGEESLANFNQYFLKKSYDLFHTPTNSDRGIDLGILFKPELKRHSKFKFHSQRVFARGVMQYELYFNKQQRFTFLLTHLKSKLNKAGDFEGRSQREKEVDKLIEIYKKVSRDSNIPTAICGDLNGIIYEDESEFELAKFAKNMGLIDIFAHLNKSHFDRSTYVYYNNNQSHLMQLDYFLIEQKWLGFIEQNSQILDFDGTTRVTITNNLSEKQRCPSDHYPVLINLNLG